MKKRNTIIILSAAAVLLAGIFITYMIHSNSGYLNEKQIKNVISNNKELLEDVVGEIEKLNYNNASVYVSSTENDPIDKLEQSPYNAYDISYDIEGLYIEVLDDNNENTFFCINNDVFSHALNIKGIVGIKRDFADECVCIYFDCGVTASKNKLNYYGFYYTKDDMPSIWAHMGVELTSASDDIWTWEDDNLGSSYYTARIAENWFYYELHW